MGYFFYLDSLFSPHGDHFFRVCVFSAWGRGALNSYYTFSLKSSKNTAFIIRIDGRKCSHFLANYN